MDALQAVLDARALLEEITPLRIDCGRYCGGACCQSDEEGQGGMLLFPAEESLYSPLPEGFSILPDHHVVPNGRLLICSGLCDRKDRPLACRLFPLLPLPGGVTLDRRGWAVCPLMEHGKRGLRSDFLLAVQRAGDRLYACPEHAAFLQALHAYNQRLAAF